MEPGLLTERTKNNVPDSIVSEDPITIATTTHLMISIYVSSIVAFWAGVAVIVKSNPKPIL